MTERTRRWQTGRTRITSVVEAQTDHIPPAFFFPTATEEGIRRHGWLVPRYADGEGRISLRVQAFVVEAGDRTVVVDPCIGNGKPREMPFWNDQNWPFLERFAEAGFDPAAVDLVVHTHLHLDHVGWDTHLVDGRWIPTFPRARHLYVDAEIDWARDNREGDTPHLPGLDRAGLRRRPGRRRRRRHRPGRRSPPRADGRTHPRPCVAVDHVGGRHGGADR